MIKTKPLLFILILTINIGLVSPWWEVGHMAVARVAEKYLTQT